MAVRAVLTFAQEGGGPGMNVPRVPARGTHPVGSPVDDVSAPVPAAPRPGRSGTVLIVATYAAAYLVVGLMSLWGNTNATHPQALTGSAWLDAWIRYDSGWYLSIAQDGYSFATDRQSPVAFFPAYPMLIRALAPLVGSAAWAGHVITVACGLGSALLFGSWVRARLAKAARWTTVALLLLYPYAVFLYGAVYGDALFLLCVLGAFTLVERRKYAAAGLIGAVATAGRPVGVAIVAGLLVRVLEQQAQDQAALAAPERGTDIVPPARRSVTPGQLWRAVSTLRPRQWFVVLSLAGIGGWCWYLWRTFGDPLAFLTAEATWSQGAGPKTWSKWAFFGAILKDPLDIRIVLGAQALVSLGAVLLLRQVWRRFGWGYLAYCLVVLGIPLVGTKDFLGCGRYVMAAFPVLAAGGALLADPARARWVRPVALTCSATAMLVATYFFGEGILIS